MQTWNLKISICFILHALGVSPKMKMHLNFRQFTHLNIGLSHSFSLSVRLTWKTVPKHSEPDLTIWHVEKQIIICHEYSWSCMLTNEGIRLWITFSETMFTVHNKKKSQREQVTFIAVIWTTFMTYWVDKTKFIALQMR